MEEEADPKSGDVEPVGPVALALGSFLIFEIVILSTTVGGRSKPQRETSQATTQREHVWRRPPPVPSDPGPQNHVPAVAQERFLEISLAAVAESLTRGTLRYNAAPESVQLSNVAFHFRPSTRGPGAFSLRGCVDWTDSRPEMGGREIAGEFVVTVVDGKVIDTRVRREDDHTMFGRWLASRCVEVADRLRPDGAESEPFALGQISITQDASRVDDCNSEEASGKSQ